MSEIALFPLPGCVGFPGQVVPLHIFEPRYRQMIKDCVMEDLLLGISLPLEIISRQKQGEQSIEEKLNSNQETYKPHKIFCAGKVEIRNELSDGRLIASLFLENRYRTKNLVQTLPYFKVEAELEPIRTNSHLELNYQLDRVKRSLAILLEQPVSDLPGQIREVLSRTPDHQKMGALLKIAVLPPEFQQQILECDSHEDAVEQLADILGKHLEAQGLVSTFEEDISDKETGKVIPLFQDDVVETD